MLQAASFPLFCPTGRRWLDRAATIQRLVSGQQQCVFGAGASLHISAITQEQMRAQVRPVSASCGSFEIAGSQALGRRSLRWASEGSV